MPRAMVSVILLSSVFFAGCCCPAPMATAQSQLFAAQRHANQMVAARQAMSEQYSAVVTERDGLQQMAQAYEAEKASLAQHTATLESDLRVANDRVRNLMAERTKLQQRYAALLDDEDGVVSDSVAGRFRDLADRYPDLDFDPHTGMSRFNGEIMFDSGSAVLKSGATDLLREFASVLNSGEAQKLKILVVGHTDDQRISKQSTRNSHASNWHLSTNRANSVVVALRKLGIAEERLGAMGYGQFQPITTNADDSSRKMNRRVEIFILAPDALIARWDPTHTRS